jgi:hypothetical protein
VEPKVTRAERGTPLEAIAVSPEGDRVLFAKMEDGEPSLWSIAVDGSDSRLLVAGTTQGEWFSPSKVTGEGPAR